MKKIHLILICSAITLVFLYVGRANRDINVIFVLLDGARADHLSSYNYDKNTTPNIDRIAAGGALFLNHFSNATATLKSVPRYMSSRYYSAPIFQHDSFMWGIRTPWEAENILDAFDDEQIILPEVLEINGYKTAIFTNHGWFDERTYLVRKFMSAFRYEVSQTDAEDENYFPEMISWIRNNKENKFFIYCHIMSPHPPYPPNREEEEFLKAFNELEIDGVRRKFHRLNKNEPWTAKQLEILEGLYDSDLKHTDKLIGMLYDDLKEMGLSDNTLIVITADHGWGLGEHESLRCGSLPWDSELKIPLIMSCPKAVPAGKKIKKLTESVDVVPTILDLCGLKMPEGKTLDGVNLKKVMHGKSPGKEAVFTEQSIRTKKYKYITKPDGYRLLYNIEKDPRETRDIKEEHPVVADRLHSKLVETMEPYKNRFENAKLKPPLKFPFYFNMKQFEIMAENMIKVNTRKGYNDAAVKRSAGHSWILNEFYLGDLYSIPQNKRVESISINAPLPNGDYDIYLLLESAKIIEQGHLKDLGLKARFEHTEEFAYPLDISYPIEQDNKTCYLNMGKAMIKNGRFRMELDFMPPDMRVYKLRHIKFIPEGSEEYQKKAISKKKITRLKDQLKSQGYW
ncbi:MAG: sulfatase [Elusimicrobiota bacterium]